MKVKVKKEIKKPTSLTLKPSTVIKARKKAAKNGKSLSEIAESLLFDYSAE